MILALTSIMIQASYKQGAIVMPPSLEALMYSICERFPLSQKLKILFTYSWVQLE